MSSPSSLGREASCLASVVLPHAQSSSPRAMRGTDLHAFMCAAAQGDRDTALEAVPEEWRPAAAAIDFERLPKLSPETGVPELALAWNPDTGEVRELGRGGDLDHDDVRALARTGELPGIIDWCSLTPDAVVVVDWKTGWTTVDRAEVNWQLRAYAVMAALKFGRSRAHLAVARLLDTGEVWWDVATLDELGLDVAEAAIRQHLRKVDQTQEAYRSTGAIPAPVEGTWCRYCPAFPYCPAKVALLLSAITGDDTKAAVLARLPEPLTEEAAAALWPKLVQAEKLIERLKDAVKDFARVMGRVRLPNGNVLTEVESQRESIDPTYAREKLYARFGEKRVERAIEKKETLTKKALDEMFTEHSSHGKKAKLAREVMAELDQAGALRAVTIRSVTEVSPKSKRLASHNPQQKAANG